jgi:hypothetical protein
VAVAVAVAILAHQVEETAAVALEAEWAGVQLAAVKVQELARRAPLETLALPTVVAVAQAAAQDG